MDFYNQNKNKTKYENPKNSSSTKHKRSSSSIQSMDNLNKQFYNNRNGNKNIIHSFNSNQRNSMFNKEMNNIEDYQRLSKKFYSIIITLQDELTKQTIRNYSLLEENLNLKQQFNEIQKRMNQSN
jgi:hypothetical protein